jgi:mono/diheme cytochrome c family protein
MRFLGPKSGAIAALLCLAIMAAVGGRGEAAPSPFSATNAAYTGAQIIGSIRRITLPHFEPQMPAAPGHDEFMRACAACHSPRYVTMQPPFSRRQWETTVRKMIDTYGAPADEVQAGKIIDYLSVVNGNGPKPQTQNPFSDDDESGAIAGVVAPEATESAPVLELAANADLATTVRRGAQVFAEDCAGCHGDDGRGAGIASQVLLPKPANLTAARFSDAFLRQTLWNGVRGTPMPSWRKLALGDLSALAAYVKSLHSTRESTNVTPDSLAHGGALFRKNCVPCHGSSGDGKGPAAITLAPPPANFRQIQPDADYIQIVLREGIPGTGMPVWAGQLSESDRVALAGYVRSLYDSPGQK